MPQVPSYTRTERDRPALRTNLTVRATPDDMGAAIGRGMASVAQGVNQAANAVAAVRDLDDNAAAKSAEIAFGEWQREAMHGENGVLMLSGRAALDGRKEFEKAWGAKKLEFSQGLKSQGAQRFFTEAIEQRRQSAFESVIIHAGRESKAMILDASTARVAMFQQDAIASWDDGAAVDKAIVAGVAELENMSKLAGWAPEVLELKVRTFASAARSEVLIRQVQQDPVAAASWLFKNPESLLPDDGGRVMAALLPAVKAGGARESVLSPDGSVEVSERVGALLEILPDTVEAEVREGIVSELLQQQATAAATTKNAYASHKGGVELAIVAGGIASEATILDDPILNDGDKAEMLRSFRAEQSSTGSARQFLAGLVEGTAPALNPYDADDKKTAEKAFDMLVAALPPVPADATPEQRKAADVQRRAAVVEFVGETQVLPGPLVNELRNGLASTNATIVAGTLELVAEVYDAAPSSLGPIEGGKEIEEAVAVYREIVTQRGLTPADAAQRILDMRNPDKVKAAKELAPLWNEAAKQLSVQNVLDTFGDNFLPGGPSAGVTPAQSAALEAAYLGAAERAYSGPAQGDINIAKQMALAELKRTYGITRVSGQDVITAYPPEAFFPPIDGGHGYIRDLALADARGIDPKASNVMLLPYSDTAADVRAGKAPRYSLMYQDAAGVWQSAPGAFTVDGASLTDLGELQSRERQIQFEMQRIRNDSPVSTYGAPRPLPADKQAALADLQKQLAAVEAERNSILGKGK